MLKPAPTLLDSGKNIQPNVPHLSVLQEVLKKEELRVVLLQRVPHPLKLEGTGLRLSRSGLSGCLRNEL